MSSETDTETLLAKLDSSIPVPLSRFDAFPKLPSTYKPRSESRGFLTLFVGLIAFLLVLNDIGEYVWGWPDHEFSVDSEQASYMNVNIDIQVNMPCGYLSVDLRDAVGDRMYLSKGLRRDGTLFDLGQATTLKEHSEALSARQAIKQSRSSRGFFTNLFRRSSGGYRPTVNYQPDGSACRVYGSLEVKKVTANLHITTLGHGYASATHVDHSKMNLSHVINEFSFGPYFPDITQPLDYSFEVTQDPFVAYQYFLHVVPTTYIAPRSKPLRTNQYSVTHYTRVLEHNRGTPGIFFKFDVEPLAITIHQRTTTFVQLLIRCVGVIGGVFVCMGYALRVGVRTLDVVTGADKAQGIVAAEATGAQKGLRAKWGGGQLRSRVNRQSSGWDSPMSGTFSPRSPYTPYSPYLSSPALTGNGTYTPAGTPGAGLGFRSPGPPPRSASGSPAFPTAATAGSPLMPPGTPGSASYSVFPPTPNPMNGAGFPRTPNTANGGGFPRGPPPQRVSSGESAGGKKDE